MAHGRPLDDEPDGRGDEGEGHRVDELAIWRRDEVVQPRVDRERGEEAGADADDDRDRERADALGATQPFAQGEEPLGTGERGHVALQHAMGLTTRDRAG